MRTTCTSCHANQAAAFAKSNHAKAMAVADDKSVRADFNNSRFEHDGLVINLLSPGQTVLRPHRRG